MSYDQSNLIQDALNILAENNRTTQINRFIKTSALAGAKIKNNLFYPAQYWLDQASSADQQAVKQAIAYDVNTFDEFLPWMQREFLGTYVQNYPPVRRFIDSATVDGNPLNGFLQGTKTPPAGEISREAYYAELNQHMDTIFSMILRRLSVTNPGLASGALSSGAGAGMNPLYTAPPPEAVQFNVASSATSNIDADYDEVYAYSYIKRSCESFIGSMDKPGRVRVNVLTSNFKFDGWWKSLPAYFSKNGSILNVLQSEIEEVVPITMPSAGTASTNYKVTYMYVPVLNSDGTPVREDIAVHRLRGGIGITEKVEVDKTEKKYYIRYVDSEGRWAAGSSWVEFTPTDDDKKKAYPTEYNQPNFLYASSSLSKTAALFRRTPPGLLPADRSGQPSGRKFTLYQLGLKQTGASTSRPSSQTSSEPSGETTEPTEETSSPKTERTIEDLESIRETKTDADLESLSFTDEEFASFHPESRSANSNIDTTRLAISLFNRGSQAPVIDVIVKKKDIKSLMDSLFSLMQDHVNNLLEKQDKGNKQFVKVLQQGMKSGNSAAKGLADSLFDYREKGRRI